jgi:hypothetical protein
MLIGQEVLGQSGVADGGPHDAEAAGPALQTISEHGVVAEDAGQCLERDAEFAEEQGAFDLLGPCAQVGHEERRPDAVGGAVFQEGAPDRDLLLGREGDEVAAAQAAAPSLPWSPRAA